MSASAWLGLPPLVSMFNGTGTAYAAEQTATGKVAEAPIESRFVLWFNGNGIPERYWIPAETGPDYELFTVSCLHSAAFRDDIHVISGLDFFAAGLPGPGNGHHNSMSGLMTCTRFTSRGAGGASIDQAIAAKIGGESRFRSLQVGVAQESFGESIQRNMSWASFDRALPPRCCRIASSIACSAAGKKKAGSTASAAFWMWCWKTLPHSRRGAEDDQGARRRTSVIRSRCGAGHRRACLPSTGIAGPPEFEDMKDWPQNCQAARADFAGSSASHAPDPGGFLHVDQVPKSL